MRICPALSLLLAAMAPAMAQKPDPAPGVVIRINVNLVQIDAVATDSNGNSVPDLKPSDFEILQDGKPQTITNFSYISIDAPPRPAPLPAVKGRPAPLPPPALLKRADVRRTIVFVVDDFFMPFEDLVPVRESLNKFVDQQMEPGDLVAVIRTSGGMGAFQRFTSDPRQVRAAIDHIHYNVSGHASVAAFTPLTNDPFAIAMQAREEMFTVGTLGAIRYVANGLREMPGRKSLVLFSENLPLFRQPNYASYDSLLGPPPDTGGTVSGMAEALSHLIEAANRSSIVVYTIDPRGLQYYEMPNPFTVQPPQAGTALGQAMAVAYSQDGLRLLAHQTGGLFLANNNDLGGLVRKALTDSSSYYLIGYHPDSATFSRPTAGVFHHLSVRVKRAGVQVRSRNGFFGNPDAPGGKRPAAPLTAQAQLQRALDAPFSAGNIHLRLTALFTDSPQSGAFLDTMLHIDGRDLQFAQEPDGSSKIVFDLLAATFGETGQAVDQVNRTYTLRCKGADCDIGRQQGFIYALSYPIKKPGAYQMRVALRDAGSQDTGSASQFIEVPDVGKGRLTLSSLILHGQSPLTPAVRAFAPGAEIEYGYQILNAHADSQNGPELEEETFLFHDGQQVFAGPVTPLNGAGQPDAKRLVAGGILKLGEKLGPGDYVLQVVVTDKLAREKYRTSAQWMDFEIRPE
jgi:VWFA-related protein